MLQDVTRCSLIAILLLAVPGLMRGAEPDVVAAIPRESGQLIVVRSKGWADNHGALTLLERASDGEWRRAATDVPVTLGRNGLAWGVGLHPQKPVKREGDGRAPAGVFELAKTYGRDAESPSPHFPYQQLSESMEGIDDSQSRWYNRLVDGARMPERDWKRSEKVRPSNPMFRWCVEVKHNWAQRPELGSCIYLHVWKAPGVATAGCTAMETAALERLVRWLDARKRPLLVQIPAGESPAIDALVKSVR